MSAAASAPVASTRSKKTSSMSNIVDSSSSKHDDDNNGNNRDDELPDVRADFVALRKKSADDLLSITTAEPFVLTHGHGSFTSGSILQSSSPPLAGRRSPSPVVQPTMTSSSSDAAAATTASLGTTGAAAAVAAAAAAVATTECLPNEAGTLSSSSSENPNTAASPQSAEQPSSSAAAAVTSTTAALTADAASTAVNDASTTTSSSLNTPATSSSTAVTSSSSGGAVNAKAPSKVSERAKKKAWYSVLYPSYKSRSEDFKKLFKGVPDDERLVVDYSCAVQRDILVHGRLYVSQNYLCFYANIFRWETCLSIRWKDVTAITKEKTALVIPNAILVSTTNEKYFITSFTSRDKAYMMLFRVWQNALMDKPMQPQEMWQWVHNCYGDELGLTSDDEDYIDPYENRTDPDEPSSAKRDKCADSVSEDLSEPQSDTVLVRHVSTAKSYSGRSKSAKLSSSAPNPKVSASDRRSASPSVALPVIGAGAAAVAVASSSGGSSNKLPHRKPISKPNARKQRNSSSTPHSAAAPGENDGDTNASGGSANASPSIGSAAAAAAASNEQLPTDMSDSSDSESGTTIPPFVCTAECTSMHEGRQLVHTILPINVDTLFALLFSKSKFLVDFHAHRKTTNMVHEDWQTGDDGLQCRKVNLTVALTQAVGPKCSHVTEHQVRRACSESAQLYSIDITSTNAGIPYADSFYVFMHYCLVRTVDDHTMFSVHAQVKYKKSVWGVVKGFIEKNTWAGLEDFYTALLRALQSEYCIPPAKAKGRRPRGRAATSSLSRQVAAAAAAAAAAGGELLAGAAGGFEGMGAMPKGTFAKCSGAGVQTLAAGGALGLAKGGAGGGVASPFGAESGAGGAGSLLVSQSAAGLAGRSTYGADDDAGRPASSRWTTVAMLAVVGGLVLVNVILYLNLWRLQERGGVGGSAGGRTYDFETEYFDFRLLKNSPKSPQEWIDLLKRQEALHATETNKWQTILQTAVQLLRKTEQTLSDLLSLIDMKEFPPQQYSSPVATETTTAPTNAEL